MNTEGFTPVQHAILEVLSDGLSHSKDELRQCLPDPLSNGISVHICNMRKLMRVQGHDILCHPGPDRRMKYRHVMLLTRDD